MFRQIIPPPRRILKYRELYLPKGETTHLYFDEDGEDSEWNRIVFVVDSSPLTKLNLKLKPVKSEGENMYSGVLISNVKFDVTIWIQAFEEVIDYHMKITIR